MWYLDQPGNKVRPCTWLRSYAPEYKILLEEYAKSPFGRFDLVRKIADESAVCEERDRGQVLDRGFEAEAWLGDVLLPIPRHLVYLFLGGLGPPSEGQINIVLDRDSAVSAFWQFPFLPKLSISANYLPTIFSTRVAQFLSKWN